MPPKKKKRLTNTKNIYLPPEHKNRSSIKHSEKFVENSRAWRMVKASTDYTNNENESGRIPTERKFVVNSRAPRIVKTSTQHDTNNGNKSDQASTEKFQTIPKALTKTSVSSRDNETYQEQPIISEIPSYILPPDSSSGAKPFKCISSEGEKCVNQPKSIMQTSLPAAKKQSELLTYFNSHYVNESLNFKETSEITSLKLTPPEVRKNLAQATSSKEIIPVVDKQPELPTKSPCQSDPLNPIGTNEKTTHSVFSEVEKDRQKYNTIVETETSCPFNKQRKSLTSLNSENQNVPLHCIELPETQSSIFMFSEVQEYSSQLKNTETELPCNKSESVTYNFQHLRESLLHQSDGSSRETPTSKSESFSSSSSNPYELEIQISTRSNFESMLFIPTSQQIELCNQEFATVRETMTSKTENREQLTCVGATLNSEDDHYEEMTYVKETITSGGKKQLDEVTSLSENILQADQDSEHSSIIYSEEDLESSGSLYFPSEEEDIEEDVHDAENVASREVKKRRSPEKLKPTNDNKNEVMLNVPTNENRRGMRNVSIQSGITISCSDILSSGKRIRNKVHSCYYCFKSRKQMAIHFEVCHAKELEVAKLLALPKNSKERRDGFANLLRVGDYYHNCEVLTSKQGELILVRRPTSKENLITKPTDFGPCPHCLGFMIRRHLWHHIKYGCKAVQKKSNAEGRNNHMSENLALISHTFSDVSDHDFLTNIVSKMINDKYSIICRQDNLILRFGALQYEKYHTTQCELIRQSMRQLARLLAELRRIDEKTVWLSDWLVPDKFDTIVAAVKNICVVQYQRSSRPQYTVPSLALKLGHHLRKLISIKRGVCLRKHDLEGNKKLTSLLDLMDLEWSYRVSSSALATFQTRKINAVELLPLTEDSMELNKYLNEKLDIFTKQLESNVSYQSWSNLASVALCKIVLFNKRRSGESSKLKLVQYSSRPDWNQTGTEEFKNSLTPLEITLASRLTLLQVRGKRGRIVNVTLTKDIKNVIDILINNRAKAGISPMNEYVFARGNDSLEHLRGHDCLRRFCTESSLKRPDLITSTKLRKYISTVCQLFNLTENESDWLARHLGHDIRVHREFYRMQESSVELTKISRLLMVIEQGEANKFVGKKLDEINIDDLPVIDEQQDNSDNEELALAPIEKNSVEESNEMYDEDKPTEVEENNSKTNPKLCNLRKKFVRRPWSEEESQIVISFFQKTIRKHKVPGKALCEECHNSSEALASRSWTDIKYFVKNYITKISKRN